MIDSQIASFSTCFRLLARFSTSADHHWNCCASLVGQRHVQAKTVAAWRCTLRCGSTSCPCVCQSWVPQWSFTKDKVHYTNTEIRRFYDLTVCPRSVTCFPSYVLSSGVQVPEMVEHSDPSYCKIQTPSWGLDSSSTTSNSHQKNQGKSDWHICCGFRRSGRFGDCFNCCSLRRAWKTGGNVNLGWVTRRMRQTHRDLSTTLWGKGFLGWGVSKLWIFEDALLFAPFSQCRAPILRPVLAEGQWSLPRCLVFSWAAEKVTSTGSMGRCLLCSVEAAGCQCFDLSHVYPSTHLLCLQQCFGPF